jgi:molybdopterin/thiamine biosynthesis adenylyltransferase
VAWWDSHPERLEHELEELRRAGIPFQKDETAFAAGLARLIVRPTIDGVDHEFVVTFPDLYPFFRFEIEAKELTLAHHQHPFAKRLCLMGRATHNWHTSDTVAGLIESQVPNVIAAGTATDSSAGGIAEEQQGEPASDYYDYRPESTMLIDGGWLIDQAATSGSFSVKFQPPVGKPDDLAIRGIVTRVFDDKGRDIARFEGPVPERFSVELRGRWVRSSAAIETNDAAEFFQRITDLDPHRDRSRPAEIGGIKAFVSAVIFPEEHSHRKSGDGWMFAVRLVRPGAKGRGSQAAHYLSRTSRIGADDLVARAPELKPLRQKRIACFGLGCIGAPSALEFARAGVGGLVLVDGDYVDGGTTLRWPFGLPAVGHYKGPFLAAMIRSHYPATSVEALVSTIGGVRQNADDMPDWNVVDRALDGSAAIYDATAEFGVQYFLASTARDWRMPYIGVAGTQGGWGGYVVRIVPGKTEGCWTCLQHAFSDGSIPSAPASADDFIQPTGCANPTFVAAGFDMTQIAMHGVRSAVGTLTSEMQGAYPSADWDVLVIALRDPQGHVVAPIATGFQLRKHASCEVCSAK